MKWFFLITCILVLEMAGCSMQNIEFPRENNGLWIKGAWTGTVEETKVYRIDGSSYPAVQLRIESGPSLNRFIGSFNDINENAKVVLLTKRQYPIGSIPLTQEEFPRGLRHKVFGTIYFDEPAQFGQGVVRCPSGQRPSEDLVLRISRLPIPIPYRGTD